MGSKKKDTTQNAGGERKLVQDSTLKEDEVERSEAVTDELKDEPQGA